MSSGASQDRDIDLIIVEIGGEQGPAGETGNLPDYPVDTIGKTYTLALVSGTLAWIADGYVPPDPAPDPTPDPGGIGVLDFSNPANSGLLGLFFTAAAPTDPVNPGVPTLDFSDPANSGLLAVFPFTAA